MIWLFPLACLWVVILLWFFPGHRFIALTGHGFVPRLGFVALIWFFPLVWHRLVAHSWVFLAGHGLVGFLAHSIHGVFVGFVILAVLFLILFWLTLVRLALAFALIILLLLFLLFFCFFLLLDVLLFLFLILFWVLLFFQGDFELLRQTRGVFWIGVGIAHFGPIFNHLPRLQIGRLSIGSLEFLKVQYFDKFQLAR